MSDAEATAHGAPVVPVLTFGDDHLDLMRLVPRPATADAARELGAGLARTHDTGAPGWGSPPDGWEGDGYFGPLDAPLPLPLGQWSSWGAFYAEARVRPMVREARDRGVYDATATRTFDRLCSRLTDGELDTGDRPARIHGDLWSGNLVWTEDGATLIDPAAHGGHRENDLALLALFGAPHLDDILIGYQEHRPLADGWRDRVGLHQLHRLLVHAILFGGGYAEQALAAARVAHVTRGGP